MLGGGVRAGMGLGGVRADALWRWGLLLSLKSPTLSGGRSATSTSGISSVTCMGSQELVGALTYPIFNLLTWTDFPHGLPVIILRNLTVQGVVYSRTVKGPWYFLCNFLRVFLTFKDGW